MNKDLDKLKGAIQMCCNMLNRSGRPAQQEAADELKAALGEFCEAARATPAQPVVECSYLRTPGTHCNKCGEVHGSPLHWTGAIARTVWQWRKRGEAVWHDADHEVATCGGDEYEYRCLYTREGLPDKQPSPSSVGAAIRALPLPQPWECGDGNHEDKYLESQVRALLSEAAALAEQVQGQQWLPIESAPRDGTEVLCFHSGSMQNARYFEWKCGGTSEKVWGKPDGWHWSERHPPTHWMPLPHPPISGGV